MHKYFVAMYFDSPLAVVANVVGVMFATDMQDDTEVHWLTRIPGRLPLRRDQDFTGRFAPCVAFLYVVR